MKKVWMVVALMAVGLTATSVFADVQNIRLSGDVRIRGYYDKWGDASESTLIAQRTRVTCEADLEDHVMVVVTLKAEGIWGTANNTHQSAGAGLNNDWWSSSENSSAYRNVINRSWAVGINEAYVQLNQVFFTPATVKIGRQYLNYGRGLIISSNEGEYNFDAARLVLDYYPLTIDLVGAQLVNNQNWTPFGNNAPGADMIFANARYELTDSLIKDIEVYAGWAAQSRGQNTADNYYVPPISDNYMWAASPWIIGIRGDFNLLKNLQTWAEFVYEGGAAGSVSQAPLQAFMATVGGKFTFADTKMCPAINANYTYVSGGGASNRAYFHPWFDYQGGDNLYNGFVFKPLLMDIQIFNLGASIKPAKNCTLAVQGYYYMKADKDGWVASNENIDIGSGDYAWTGGRSSDVGWEVDASVGYDYSKDVRCQLIYGAFIPGRDFRQDRHVSQVANGVRAEINVKF